MKHKVVSNVVKSCKISVILILLFVILFRLFVFINPSITGYAVVQNAYSQEVNSTIRQSSEQTVTLQNPGELSSLKISGNVIGKGIVRVYLKVNNDKYLVYDNSLNKNENLITANVVAEELNAAVNETTNLIENITINQTENATISHAPEWSSEISSFAVDQGSSLTINLSNYFYDLDNDTLSYLSSSNENIDVVIDNFVSLMTIIPKPEFSGNSSIILFAGDGKELTTKEIVIVVNPAVITAFEFECAETCLLNNVTASDIILVAELENASLVISSINYNVFEAALNETAGNLSNETIPALEITNITIRKFHKTDVEKNFKAAENAEFELEFVNETELLEKGRSLNRKNFEKKLNKWIAENETVEASVIYNFNNEKISFDVEIEEIREGKFFFNVVKPRQFRAGLYTLEVNFTRSGETTIFSQDFAWGVLAINTHKSVYLPDENAKLSFGVLNDAGSVVCNAMLSLEITDPFGIKTLLSTENGGIARTDDCYKYGDNVLPDYIADYAVSSAGVYIMNLTAETYNGIRNLIDNFTVMPSVDFDFERIGPTRIWPPAPYNVSLVIKANKNYNGAVREYVPASFEIMPKDGVNVATVGSEKVISFDVNLKKGDIVNLSYTFDAPDESPQFYLLGKAEIGSFSEARFWQIASDQVLSDNDASSGINDMNLVEGDSAAVTISYTTDNFGTGSYTWVVELRLQDTNGERTAINQTCGNGNDFNVTSITFSCPGGQSCVANNTAGTGTLTWAKNKAGTVTWNILACTGSSTASPYNITTNETSTLSDDMSWNLNTTANLITVGLPPDNTLPSVLQQYPANNSINNTGVVNFNCSATDNQNLLNISLWSNFTGAWALNDSWCNVTGTDASCQWNKTLPSNTYIWGCRAFDLANNSNWTSQNWTVTVDTLSPTFSNALNSSGYQYENVTMNITISNNAVDGYIFSTNITGTWTNDSWADITSNPTTYNANTSKNISLAAGVSYGWKYYANDTAGNMGESIVYNATVKTDIMPNVSLVSPADGTSSTLTSFTFNASGTDDRQLVNATLYWNYTGVWLPNGTQTMSGTSGSANFTRDNLAPGSYIWNVQFCDNVGQCNFSLSNYTLTLRTANKYCAGNYTEGSNWIVSRNITCANETIYVDTNITILNNGSLTLYNVTLNFSAFADGSNFINKSPNGGLYIYDLDSNASTQEDGSWIMSNDSNYEYDFWAFGNGLNDNLTIRNSKFTDAGYSSNSQGIKLYNVSNVVVSGNNISGGAYFGLYLQYSTNNNITNNIINTTADVGYGIYLYLSSNSNTLQSNRIITSNTNSHGILLSSSSNSNITGNTITTTGSIGYGIYLSTTSNSNTLQSNTITTIGGSGYGIYLYLSSNSNTLTSNTITTNGSSGYGIYLETSSNSNISSNTITTNRDSGYGIYLVSSSNSNILQSNTITTNGSSGFGIFLSSSSSNNATSNIINATGTNADGVYIWDNSDNNILNLNNISSSGRDGIRIENSGTLIPERNNITNNIILNSTEHGIFITNTLSASQLIQGNNISYSGNFSILLSNASNITIIGGSLEYSKIGVNATSSINVTVANATFVLNTLWDFYITDNSWVISLNNSFNSSINVINRAGDFSNFTVMWYARANVTNSSGIHMNSSSVTSTDVNSATEWTDTTTNGLTGWFAAIDYIQNGTAAVSYNLHTASASLTGYLDNSSTYNVSIKNITGTQVDIVLKNPVKYCNNSYIQGQVTWNITSNLTCANETIYVDGNITIFNNGSLTLYNVTINFSAFADGSNFINKSPNGGLYIYDLDSNASTQEDGSWIMSNNSEFEYNFWAFGNGLNDNLTIRNSKFTDAGYSPVKSQGIQLYNVSNVVVSGNNVTDGARYGLYLQYSTNNNITNNQINTTGVSGYGIYLASSSNSNTLQSNTITTSGSGDGIYLESSSQNNISSNTITKSGSSGYGISLSSSSNTLSNNIITTSNTNGYGIYLLSSSNSTLQSNNITTSGSSGGYGINLGSSSNSNTLQSNTITTSGETGYGIYLTSSSQNNVSSNTITTSNTNAYGIYLLSSSNSTTIQSNTITTTGSSGRGISLASSSNSNISSNTITISGSSGYGIRLYSSSNNNATSNIINATGTNADGVYIFSDSDNNIINLNNISKSGRDGVRVEGSTNERNNITNNIILNATEHGIFVNNTLTASQLIQGNNISYSGNFSILLNNASNITIIGGSLEYSKIGINATSSINVTVTNATFVLNTLWDFYITNNSWVVSLNNSFNSSINVTDIPNDYSNFTVMWYARANVTNSSGIHMNSSSVTSTDVNSATEWTDTTTNGLTGWFAAIDYIQNGTATVSYNLHTASASGVSGHFANSSTYNVSVKNITGTQVDIVLKNPVKYCNNSYTQGQVTWNITSNLTCANQTIYVDGNITIFNNGSLTLYNVTINFSMFNDRSSFINKSPNGGLYIYDLDSNASTQEDGSWIMSNDSSYEYDFWAFGNGLNDNFTMRNSKVSDAGCACGASTSQGIRIYNINNVVINGNNISGGTAFGINLVVVSNSSITNNTVYNSGYAGIYLSGSLNNSITNNTVYNSDEGINLISSSNSNILTGNIIYNNTLDGIPLSLSSNSNILTGNTIYSNGRYGISISSSLNNNISSNTINTSGSSDYGIYLYSSSNSTTIQNNTITTNGTNGYGIYLITGSNSNTLQSNIITTNGSSGYGIFLDVNSDFNNLTNNDITTLGGGNSFGIYLESGSNTLIKGNTINTTSSTAVDIESPSASNIVRDNTITAGVTGIDFPATVGAHSVINNSITSVGRGINCVNCAINNITNNTINTTGANGYGIYFFNNLGTTITGNVITTNSSNAYGIYFVGTSDSNTLQSNTITTNGSDGYGVFFNYDEVNLAGPSSNNITSNIITTSGSSAYGVYLNSSSSNNITSNIINATGANADGVYILSNSSNNIFNLNNITKSGRDGIRIGNSGTNIPERNNITNNIILNSTEHGIFANNTLTASQLIQGNNISYSGNMTILLLNASNITIIGGSLEYSKIGLNATLSKNITITNATFVLNTLWDFYITNNSWVISLNNSFNSSVNVSDVLGDYSNFTVMWYARANVTNSSGIHMNSSSVTSTDVNSNTEWTDTTTNGLTGWFAAIDYIQNGTATVSYNLHTASASLTGYLTNSSTYNVSIKNITGTQVDIVLKNAQKFCNGNYTEGQATWNITSNITCANQTIYVAGNITIFNNGSLTLYNVTINFSMFADGSGFINKSPNGGLFIYDLDSNLSTLEDGSWIMSNDSNYKFNFWAFGNGLNDNFTMQNSKVTYVGSAPIPPFMFSNGIELSNISNITISGNNVSDGTLYGLFFLGSSNNNNITYNSISGSTTGIDGSLSSSRIINNTIDGGLTISSSNIVINNTIRKTGFNDNSLVIGSNNLVENNVITSTVNVYYVISLASSNNNNITSNTITTNGTGGYGILLSSSTNNNITSNIINATGAGSIGIYVLSNSTGNTISFNNITKSGQDGIIIVNFKTSIPGRNNITNNIILNSTEHGISFIDTLTAPILLLNNNISYSGNASISLSNASNITIIGGSLEYSKIGLNATSSRNVTITNATFVLNTLWDFYITNNSWVISLNNSFNKTGVNITNSLGDYSNFTNQYYVDVNVTDGDSAIVSGATVYAYENTTSSWSQQWTESTGTNGFTGKWATTEYVQNGTTVVNYTSNFTATKLTKANSTTRYITSSQQVDVRIPAPTKFCNGNYTEGQATWNITSNVTCSNETIYVAGNITIFNNGSLTLYNVTINFSAFADGSNFINKSPNGGLFIYDLDSNASTQEDATEIISNNSDYEYDFWAYGNGANDNLTIRNSKFTDAGYGSNSLGIQLYNVSNVIVSGNNVSGGALRGLYLQYSTNNNLSNNNINTTGGSGYGIYLLTSSNSNTLQSNTITTSGTSGYGIYLDTSSNSNTIQSNTITTSGSLSGYGIYLYTSSNSNTLQSNTVTTSKLWGYGIFLSSSSNSNITGNTITTTGSTGFGIYLSSSSNSTIQNNTITASGTNGRGIYLSSSSNNNATSNIITTNSSNADGIYIFSNSDSNIFNLNNITKSGRDGIRLENSGTSIPERNNITNNIILNSTEHGIFANNTKTASQLIQGNNISYSGNFSILLNNASNITIIGGSLEYSKIGLNATNSINVTVTNATFVLNSLWDFYITNNSGVISLNNSFNSSVNVTDILNDYSNFTVMWYARANVTNSSGIHMNSSSVTSTDVNSNTDWTDTTTNGLTGWFAAIDYIQNGTAAVSYNLHTASASGVSGHFANSSTYNVSVKNITGTQVDIVLKDARKFCNGNYTEGQATWNITSNITCYNETIYVAGNITIYNNGSLTLYNVTINFSMFADGSSFINKSPNGGLYIYDLDSNASTQEDATEIISNDSNYEYDFWAFGNGLNDNLTIRNSKFTDVGYATGGSSGLQLYNVSNAKLIGNNVSDGTKYGIYLQYSTNNNLSNNIINTNAILAYGIRLSSSSNSNTLQSNTITASSVIDGYGIYLSSSLNNNITSNTITTADDGISLSSSNNSNISGNTITTSGAVGTGIVLASGSDSNIVQNNTVTVNDGGDGISSGTNSNILNNIITVKGLGYFGIVPGPNNNISGNTITVTGDNGLGITLNSVSNLNITGNIIITNGSSSEGIELVSSSSNNSIVGNTINSSSAGIYLSSSNSNRLRNNTITTNGSSAYGISLSSSNNNNITSNTITTNGSSGYGIYLSSSNNGNITGNVISTSGTSGYGISLDPSSSSNALASNTITTNGSTSYGIYLYDWSSSNTLASNTITTNGSTSYGIYLDNRANTNNLTSNIITTINTDGYGIRINGLSNRVQSNTITTNGSTGYGIYLSLSSNNNATSNIIATNGSNADGIYVLGGSDNNILNLNNITKAGRDGIRIENSGTDIPERNNITNNIILNATEHGIFVNNTLNARQLIQGNNISYSGNFSILLSNASNITIIGGSLEYSKIGLNATLSRNVTVTNATFVLNTLWDFYITNNSWVISLNNSFNSSVNVTNRAGDYSNFTVMWYARANVTNSTGIHMNSSSVTSTDVLGGTDWTDTTTNGLTGWFAAIDYIQNGTAAVSYNLHTASASLTSYLDNSSTYNVSIKNITGTQVDIVLKDARKFCNGNYTEGQATWNVTSNVTCANETIYVAGNITIFNNGSLTLYNVTINFSMFADGSGFINKSPNGGLFIYDLDSNASTQEDGSWIMSNDSSYEYDFWVFGNGANDNFTLQNSIVKDAGYATKSRGIQLYNVSNVVVSGNNVSGGALHGLYLQYSTNNNLSSNTINTTTYSGYGIYLSSGSNSNTLQSNTITTSGDSGRGIALLSSSNSNNISSNTITISGTDGYGISLATSSNSNTLQSNTITTTVTNGYGIYLLSSSNSNTLQSNTITTTGLLGYGIYLLSSSNSNTLSSNTITTNGSSGYGISLIGSSTNNITGNTITTNNTNGYGIYFQTSSNSNTFQSNTITTNGGSGYGIYLLSSSNSNTLQSNTITTNGSSGYGIYLLSSSNSNISSNTITTNGSSGYGVFLSASSNNNATGNKINATGTNADGVYIFSNSDNNIFNLNNISKSGRDGIRIENSGASIPERNNITNNIILNATEHGIFANNTLTASQLIQGNNISYSGNASILLNNASNITIIGGSLEYGKIGINATNSINVTVTNATFVLNSLWDFYITNNSWVVSLNNSFNSSVNVTNILNDYSNFTVMWYARANVTNSSGIHMNSSSVTSTDVNSNTEWTDTTTNGLTGWFAAIDYIQNGTAAVSYNLHTASASGVSGHFANSSTYNVSVKNITGTQVDIVLKDARKFCNGNYTEGQATWNVTSNVTCANETIYVAGNITIFNNGSLTLYNVTINFSMFADGSGFINKSPNGGLFIYDLDSNASTQEDATEIISNNSDYEYDFWVFGNGANDNFTLQNSIVKDAGYATKSRGIQLYNVSNVVVSGNNVTGGAQYGLYLLNSTNNNLSSNTINTTAANGYGIWLQSVSNSNTLQSNTITTSGSDGRGISLRSNSNTIQNNTITTSGVFSIEGSIGVYLYSSSTNNIKGNTITTSGTGAEGIYLEQSSNSNTFQSNTITTSGSSGNGIYLESSSNSNTFQSNTITTSNSNNYGIYLVSSSNSNISSNTITTNGSNGYGIYLSSSSNNNATSNIINATGTNADGVYIFSNSDNNIINSNNITKSGRDGVRVEGSTNERNNITNNIILNATEHGIFINNTKNAYQLIQGNNISYSGNFSILLKNASNITIIGGSLEYSKIGINATSSRNVTVTNATFVLNTLWDFYITNNSWVISINNSFNSSVNVTDIPNDYSNFTVMWYARANVTNSSGIHMNSSSVTSTDVNSATEWTDTTTNGLTGWFAAIDYIQNGTAAVSYNLHTASASGVSGHLSNSSTYNVSIKNITGTQVDIVLKNPAKYCNNSYTEGQATWNVTSNITCANETIYVAGNITIFNNGSLTLRNVTINFSAFADGSNFINKSPNGGLFIYDLDSNASTQEDATEIISNNSSLEFDFWVFGNGNNDNFTMQNSIVRDAGYAQTMSQGIQLYNVSNVVVSGNNITDGARYGLYLQYSTNNNITGNQINMTSGGSIGDYGIYLLSSSSLNNIKNNTITTNGASGGAGADANYGIYVATSSNDNTIQGNTVTPKATGSSNYGIFLSSSSNSNITGNTITTSYNTGYGIYLLSSSSSTISGNNITTNGSTGGYGYGILLSSSSNANITGNTVTTTGSYGYGIYLASSNSSIILNNTITTSGNDAPGIYLSGSSNSNITSNTITTMGAFIILIAPIGISLASSSNTNTLQSNTITTNGSTGYGIYLSSSSNNNATSNIINATGANADGIYIFSNSSNNIINSNNISKSGRDGIRIANSGTSLPERNNITNNIILNSTEHGIFITNTLSASQLIQGNNISYSGNFSILLSNASNITIIGGSLEYSRVGVNASQSVNVTVTNATFVLNTLWDFYITNNSWVIGLNNSFNKTGVNITNSLGDYSNFTNQYYVDVNVTWSNSSAASGATVFTYENSTGSWTQQWSDTTAATGFTGKWATVEYVQNGTTIVNYTSNFTANYTTSANSTIKYITNSQQVDVRINVTGAPPPGPSFNITFLITKTLAPDMIMAASNETINVTTTIKVNRTTNSISFINITDEIPYDFIYENESRIAVLFINWSDAGSNTIDITANVTKTIVDYAGSVNTLLIINISNMSTSLGYYMTENDSIQINYLMNSSKMNANDTRIVYTNVTVKDIASNEAADFKLTNITSSQIVLRGYKKISVDPANPQNVTVGIEMQSLGGKLTSILLVDYLPNSITAKSNLVGLNVSYYNKTSNTYVALTEPEDYRLYNPYNSTLPDGQPASVFSYNFSYNFTNWDGTIYENDSLLINYSIAIAGGGSWVLPAIIGGWDPQYQKHIKTEMYTQADVPSFDVITKVLTPKIKPGEDVKALLQMLNVGGPKAKVDVFVTYSMKTMSGELITERSETLAVVEQKEKELLLPTPSTIKPGMYTFETFVTYTGREAVSTDVFEVLGEKGSGFNAQWLMFGIFGLVMVLIIIFVIIRTRKKEQ